MTSTSRLLREPAEKALHEALAGIVTQVERALGKRDYGVALARLATLRPAVDGFFDDVMVNAEDLGAAPQPARAAGAAALSVHAHRGSVLPAGLTGPH